MNVEAQDYHTGYPRLKRAIYYCSRMISAQHGTEFTKFHYEKVRKVYSIWICSAPPEDHQNTITRYRMTEENIIGSVKEDVRNYDLMTVIMVCPGQPDETEQDGILRLLSVLLSSVQQSRKRSGFCRKITRYP